MLALALRRCVVFGMFSKSASGYVNCENEIEHYISVTQKNNWKAAGK